MLLKTKKYLSESEIKKTNKNFNKLRKSMRFKKFHGTIDSVDYDDLDNYIIIMVLLMTMNIEKLEALEHYLKSLMEIITNQ